MATDPERGRSSLGAQSRTQPRALFLFILGAGRSGTTLLQMMFDMRPDIAVAHEAHFVASLAAGRRRYGTGVGFDHLRFCSDLYRNANFLRLGLPRESVADALSTAGPRSFSEAVRVVFSVFAENAGKPLYGDKTPGYVNRLGLLARLFPEARFIHLIRDGRDVTSGYLDQEWGPNSTLEAGHYWRTRVGRGRRDGARWARGRYLEVRYEDLVERPESELTKICEFLDLAFDPSMLRYHEEAARLLPTTAHPDAHARLAQPPTPGVRNWRVDLSPEAVTEFEVVAGTLLGALGYERTHQNSPMDSLKFGLTWVQWQVRRARSRLPVGGPAQTPSKKAAS